ncbi:3-oxoacyl-[acyl-carrier-protein] synthase-3 [Nocardia transvalensis]|uniref:3-oxoacyl-[acyl-carrier-protein] synthase-3 n=1 Tax=Nocardia transvalensis TaxID=37333 RepID=A0A7W9PLK9_9NOCA|nr:hypothetical protein [Nocardia transvalensis]MBB5918416.1 3-oxoacyl-[acyl-carrier-protein] synthase-3 [Nocardia transvalensis]
MSTAIVSAATCLDLDTGSYFELATRAGHACLEQAGVAPERVGIVVNAGVFRDSNISEPAVAALIQQRLGIGLEYSTGQVPTFSFDLMNGAGGVVHALTAVHSFLAPGEFEYALIVAGDTHPSTRRYVEGFPYTAGGAALLLRSSTSAGGFGRPYTTQTEGAAQPTAWVDLTAAGTGGRTALSVRSGPGDPLAYAAEVVRSCMDGEGIDRSHFATGAAVLLTPAPEPGFRERLAYRLGVPIAAVAGVDPAVGDPYTAAPVHAYLTAAAAGLLDGARAVLFLAADDSSAVCVAYRPQPLESIGAGKALRTKHIDV